MSNKFMRHLALQFIVLLFAVLQMTSVMSTEPPPPDKQSLTLATKNFWQLNSALAVYQEAANHPWPLIPDSPQVLKIGTKSTSVLELRHHLKITGDLAANDDLGNKIFDTQLANAVRIFQARHGMKVDGVVGNDTRAELNVPPELRMKQIALNMQRWASLSGKLGDRFIIVNIPAFHMYLVENNQIVLSLRAIVGKPELPTPQLTSKITRIEFNPYWNIPNTIAKNDIAPKMSDDPSYLNRMHIRVFRSDEDDSPQVSPGDVDWQSAQYDGVNYHLRQDPGPQNALGQVKFEFQNTENVYMHDTPAKNLFETDIRDYSHGCIRLEKPFALVDYLMKDDTSWNADRLQDILDDGKTKYVRVQKPIPIFITYITAWVDDAGRVNFRDDVYQLDDDASSSPVAKVNDDGTPTDNNDNNDNTNDENNLYE